jgi:hypothetical protein
MSSWVIVEKSTGKAIYETWNYELAQCFDTQKNDIVPVLKYLQEFNRKVKEQKQKDEWLRKTNKEIREGSV